MESIIGSTCWEWPAWFGDTGVCEPRDKIGFVIGLVSILCWAMAEVPQLVANALEGSSEGLSEGLLWLWVFSDVLDVVGCSISDTLPTMVITAWMYFLFTVLLLLQHIYYTRIKPPTAAPKEGSEVDLEARLLFRHSSDDDPDMVAELFGQQPPLLTRRGSTASQHTMYGSLRNLSIRHSTSSNSLSFTGAGRHLQDSFVNYHQHRRRAPAKHPLHGSTSERPSTADAATLPGSLPESFSAPVAVSKMMAGLTLVALLACVQLTVGGSGRVRAGLAGRVLLGAHADEQYFLGVSYAVWGSIMGWTMAVTFFLGRVPQVIKNWQRQSCAGLSIEMFIIVLTAAVTYCASILIRVRSFADLLPCLPFFTDAALGAVLDVVILAQFFLYKDVDEEGGSATGGPGSRADSNHRPGGKASPAASPSTSARDFGSFGGKLEQPQQQPSNNAVAVHDTQLLSGAGAGDMEGGPGQASSVGATATTADFLTLDQLPRDNESAPFGGSWTNESVISIATI